MTDTTGISPQDLATIGGKVKANSATAPMKSTGFLQDLGLLVAQLAFVPLAIITLIPESRVELAGFGLDAATSAVLWAALLVSGFFTLAMTKSVDHGKLANFGVIALTVAFVMALPIILGFVAMTLVTTAVGGPEVLLLLWKPIAFFSFIGVWFKSLSSD